MLTQEIVAITFRAWCKSTLAQDYPKVQVYLNHLQALGYSPFVAPDGYNLLKEEKPCPLTLSQRYRLAAHKLRWHDRGVRYSMQARMKYLAFLLDTLARQLQHKDLIFTLAWIHNQQAYEKCHNVYAYRLLCKAETHLTRTCEA